MTDYDRLHYIYSVGVKLLKYGFVPKRYVSSLNAPMTIIARRSVKIETNLYRKVYTYGQPLYRFIRDQGYELIDGRFIRREKDHDQIIGYDDVNQLFWYPEGIARIVLTDKVCPLGANLIFQLITSFIRLDLSMYHPLIDL